jgi:putative addiction module component (TIGR02574 family)
MTASNQAVFDAALALPADERALLVERLLETLSPAEDELTDDELAAELDRRRDEIERGAATPIAWSEVKDQA